MILSNTVTITKRYQGKSKYSFWTDLREGDELQVNMKLEAHRGRNGLYSPTITLYHFVNGENKGKFVCGIGDCSNYLSKVEYV